MAPHIGWRFAGHVVLVGVVVRGIMRDELFSVLGVILGEFGFVLIWKDVWLWFGLLKQKKKRDGAIRWLFF